MKVLVTGAAGLVGEPLSARCAELDLEVLRSGSRGRSPEWLAWDMAQAPLPRGSTFDSVMHTAPLWLLPGHLPELAARGARRIVCYGSTSALTKQASSSPAERRLAESLSRAEDEVLEESPRLGMAATVLRPTMTYGYGRDGNVNAIARFIRRYGFFAVAGGGRGRRQPVHVDDLVDAALATLDNSATYGKAYNLSGGETLTYLSMVQRIFECLNRPSRIVRLPTGLYKLLLDTIALAGGGVSGSIAERMNQDMVFDAAAARRDFGFAPARFLEHPERDLAAA